MTGRSGSGGAGSLSGATLHRLFIPDHPPLRTGTFLHHPWIQTLAAAWPGGGPARQDTVRWQVPTRDGDVLVLHENRSPEWIAGDRVVVLVHGLCGSHASPYMARAAARFVRAGLRTFRVDMRGCGDALLRSRGHFHAGASADLEDVLKAVGGLSPLSPVTLIGYSLGGNVALRLAGLRGADQPDRLDSVIAVAPPVDLVWCTGNLRQWGNRVFDHFFVRRLKWSLGLRRRHVSGLWDNGLVRLPGRLVHLDDQFVAPVCGFSGARDYYRRASAAPLLESIRLPTLIVSAEDDPLVPVEIFRRWPRAAAVELVTPRHGGHLGFFGTGRGDPDRNWLDWRLVSWVGGLDRPGPGPDGSARTEGS